MKDLIKTLEEVAQGNKHGLLILRNHEMINSKYFKMNLNIGKEVYPYAVIKNNSYYTTYTIDGHYALNNGDSRIDIIDFIEIKNKTILNKLNAL